MSMSIPLTDERLMDFMNVPEPVAAPEAPEGMVKLTAAQYKKIIAILNARLNKDRADNNKKTKNRAKNKNARKARRKNRIRAGK